MVYSGFSGQSAIEYLMTYGWMLLVVAIAGGAIFSMVGEQNIESVQGFDSQDINVQDFGISTENGLMFSMTDPIGQTTVTEITVSNPDTTNITYVINQDVSEQKTVNLPGITPSEGRNELDIQITYESGNLENITTTGMITGTMEVDRAFHNRKLIIDGLVGYWPLDQVYKSENIIYDLSGNQNHGEPINNPMTTEGLISKDGQGLDFNPEESQYVSSSLEGVGDLSEYTLCGWTKPSEVPFPDEHGNGRIVNMNSGGSSRTFIGGNSGSETFRFQHNSDDEATSITGGQAEEGEVFFVAGVFNDPNMELYVNGESVAEGSAEGPLLASHTLTIGRWTSDSHRWNGILDDVCLYDRALSKDEIQTIYKQSDTQ